MVAYDAVVCHVRIGHDQAVAAHHGATFRGGATVDGDALADGGAVANFGGGVFARKLQVLGDARDDGTGEDAAVTADARAVEDDGVGIDVATVANDDVALDVCEGIDGHALANAGFGVDDGCGCVHVGLLVFDDLGHELCLTHHLLADEDVALHRGYAAPDGRYELEAEDERITGDNFLAELDAVDLHEIR